MDETNIYTEEKMDAFIGCCVFIVGFILYKFLRMGAASIPIAEADEINGFKKTLPHGFAYAYYLDNTGYAVNVEEGTIYLLDANHYSGKSSSKIYNRSQIREISWQIDGWEYVHDYRPLAVLDNAVNKREAKHQAYKDSGIFIKMADIDHPTWQIRFSSKPLLERNYEIIHQFMDGILPAPQEQTGKN